MTEASTRSSATRRIGFSSGCVSHFAATATRAFGRQGTTVVLSLLSLTVAAQWAAIGLRDRYVYELSAFGEVFYFGIGKGGRIERHVANARGALKRGVKPKGRKSLFIAHCIELGIPIHARKTVTGLTRSEAYDLEIDAIASYGRRATGAGYLLNLSPGGFGGRDLAPSTRAKMSSVAKKRDPATRAAQKAARLGSKHTPESRAKISAAGLGRKASPEASANMSAARRGKKKSPEAIAKREATKRRRHTARTRSPSQGELF